MQHLIISLPSYSLSLSVSLSISLFLSLSLSHHYLSFIGLSSSVDHQPLETHLFCSTSLTTCASRNSIADNQHSLPPSPPTDEKISRSTVSIYSLCSDSIFMWVCDVYLILQICFCRGRGVLERRSGRKEKGETRRRRIRK